MMKTILRFVLMWVCILCQLVLFSQQRVDRSFSFRNTLKKYSLFIPSSYQPGQAAVLALHPLNTNRWNSTSWCDTLKTFAENNQLLLICPDGGIDGRIDDEIDIAFTTVLLDSVFTWYPYNKNKLIALGFSWGGRTVYSYGLSRPDLIYGLIPIGAAIEGFTQLQGKEQGAKNKSVYIIHGSTDDPANRFTPAKQFFARTTACVFDTLMPGVGHTIDFPNRNAILSMAYQKVLGHNCMVSSTHHIDDLDKELSFYYTQGNIYIQNELKLNSFHFSLFNIDGKIIDNKLWPQSANSIAMQLTPGIYFIHIQAQAKSYKLIVP